MKKHTESLITFIKVNRIDRYLYPRLLHNDHHYHFLCRDPHIPPGHIFPRTYTTYISQSRTIFSFQGVRHFSPFSTAIRRSTIQSDLPLACTKLIEVDGLGSGVQASAGF